MALTEERQRITMAWQSLSPDGRAKLLREVSEATLHGVIAMGRSLTEKARGVSKQLAQEENAMLARAVTTAQDIADYARRELERRARTLVTERPS